MDKRIPETSTQVKTDIDIDHQRRRPYILGRESARGIVTAQVLIVICKAGVGVGDRYQLICSKSRINQDLGIEQAAAGLGVVSVAGAVAECRGVGLVARG